MTNRDDRFYHSRRADEEIQRGDDATTVEAAIVHYELAYRYSIKAGESLARVPKLTLIEGRKTVSPMSNWSDAPLLIIASSRD